MNYCAGLSKRIINSVVGEHDDLANYAARHIRDRHFKPTGSIIFASLII